MTGNNSSCSSFGREASCVQHNPAVFPADELLLQQEGKYRGNPKRTHAGGTWLNGYSDHLPTIVYLIKEIK